MKIVFFLRTFSFIILFTETLFAQTYFSRRYDFHGDNGSDYSQDILEEIDGYTLLFESQNPFLIYRLIAFQKLDLLGNVIGIPVIYYDSNCNIQTGFPGSFIKLSGGDHYACLATKMLWVPEGRYDRGWLMIMDNTLDTLWTKTYTDDPPHDTSIMFRNFRQLDDGGFIVTGLYNPVSGTGLFRIGLFRLDNNGNLQWKRRYGSGNIDYQAFDVTKTSDSGFVIGAVSQPPGSPYAHDNDAMIIKTDSNGMQEWISLFGNPDCLENHAMVDMASDGNIQVGIIFSDTCWSDNVWVGKINFIKVRNNKSVVWDKKYGIRKVYSTLSKVKVLFDSDIIGIGWYWDYSGGTGPRVVSWIIRTDSAGNEKWYREYVLLEGNKSFNQLWNIIPTTDNGFAACGFVVPRSPDTGTQDSWVLKVDSLGCEAPNQCWVGQDKIWVKTFTPEKPFIVYPNPATDKLTLEFHINPEGAELELFSLTGQMVLRSRVSRERDLFEWDIGRLRKGMYILKVSMPGKRPVMEKVVVE